MCYRGPSKSLQAYFLSAIIFKYCKALWAASLWALPQEIPEPWQTVMGLVDSSARHWYCPLALSSSVMTHSNGTVKAKWIESRLFVKTSFYYCLRLQTYGTRLCFFIFIILIETDTKTPSLNSSSSQTQLCLPEGAPKKCRCLGLTPASSIRHPGLGVGVDRFLHFLLRAPKAILMWLVEQCLQIGAQWLYRGKKPFARELERLCSSQSRLELLSVDLWARKYKVQSKTSLSPSCSFAIHLCR